MIKKVFDTVLDPVAAFLSDALENLLNDDLESDHLLSRFVALRHKKGLDKLFAEFMDVYGVEGEVIASHPSRAVYFNGGLDPQNPNKYFPGPHYSLPLLAYVMRGALDKNTPEKSYEKYIKNVNALVRDFNRETEAYNQNVPEADQKDIIEIKAYPSHSMIEKICAPTFRALDNLLEKKAGVENEHVAYENVESGVDVG